MYFKNSLMYTGTVCLDIQKRFVFLSFQVTFVSGRMCGLEQLTGTIIEALWQH